MKFCQKHKFQELGTPVEDYIATSCSTLLSSYAVVQFATLWKRGRVTYGMQATK